MMSVTRNVRVWHKADVGWFTAQYPLFGKKQT